MSLSRVSHVIEDISSSIVVASLGEDETTSESGVETRVVDETAVIETEEPLLDGEFERPQRLQSGTGVEETAV